MSANIPTDEEAFKKQLLNRQVYAVGAEAQKKYQVCDVLVVGMTGLGLELVKNLVLSGVRSVTMLDDSPIQWSDLSSTFYAQPADVGKPRAATLLPKICELNRFVKVTAAPPNSVDDKGLVHDELLRKHSVAVFVDKRTTILTEQNRRCRDAGVKMVCCESRGVACSVFCDAGPGDFVVHDVNGREPAILPIIDISSDGAVEVAEANKHNLADGDEVFFSGVAGCPLLCGTDHDHQQQPPLGADGDKEKLKFKVAEVMTPFEFRPVLDAETLKQIEAVSAGTGIYTAGGYVHTSRNSATIKFKSLEESVAAPEFSMICDDNSKFMAAYSLHTIFRAIHNHRRGGDDDAFVCLRDDEASVIAAEAKNIDPGIDECLVKTIATAFHGNLSPMAAFVGGVAAQEVLKLASGKYRPIEQWFYYDMRELVQLRPEKAPASEFAPRNNRYDGQVAVLGASVQQKLLDANAFIVGAGALGCEHIKNLAMMGLGCGGSGASAVTVTDMDTIELSNLSRQFLFRQHHVAAKRSKSSVAAEAAKEMNSAMNVVAKELKVGPETEAVFSRAFFERQACVITALDNPSARRYIDQRCVMHQRPMFDSGTNGAKCSTQVVVPHLTEPYSSQADAPSDSFMVCTLKNFPNAIEHTIHWAKEAFGSEFGSAPAEVNKYLFHTDEWRAAIEREPRTTRSRLLTQLKEHLEGAPRGWGDCVRWARAKFEEFFVTKIKRLLHKLPPGSEKDGKPVWGGAKRPPTPAVFNPDTQLHMDFIIAAASLRAAMYNIECPDDSAATLKEHLAGAVVPEWKAELSSMSSSAGPAATEGEDESDEERQLVDADAQTSVVFDSDAAAELTASSSLVVTEADLPPLGEQQFGSKPLVVQEFEKDDDTNFHIDFMTAVSNLRATNYGIPVATRDHTKFVAGKIIPAMITTTASATGLVGLDVLKYFMGANKLEHYRNSFMNLATASSMVVLAPAAPRRDAGSVVEYVSCLDNTTKMSLGPWDKFEVDCTIVLGHERQNRVRIKDMLRMVQKTYGLLLDSLAVVVTGATTTDIPLNESTIRNSIVDTVQQIVGFERDFCCCAVSSCSARRVVLPQLVLRIK